MNVADLKHGKLYYTAFGEGRRQYPILWDAKKRSFLDLTYGERLTPDEVKVIAKFPEMEPLDCTPNTEAKRRQEMMDRE